MRISFIGFGNMAKSIAKGLLCDASHHLSAAAPSLPEGINEQGIHTYPNNLTVLKDADVLILAVKPFHMKAVMEQISGKVPKQCLVISVATGLTLDWYASHLPQQAIVRAMPNIAAAVGASATPLLANGYVLEAQRHFVEQVFKQLGIMTWVTKDGDIDVFTAVSGSGPAYVFFFMEAIIKTALELGLSKEIATTFTLQTLQGAVDLVKESGLDISDLRNKVTAKAGTTEAALRVFTAHKLEELIDEAIHAAYNRAKQLAT